MSLFDKLGNTPQQMNPQQAMQELRAHPVETLKRAGFNIPAGINNPTDMINHLLQTEQINNPKLQALNRLAANLFRR